MGSSEISPAQPNHAKPKADGQQPFPEPGSVDAALAAAVDMRDKANINPFLLRNGYREKLSIGDQSVLPVPDAPYPKPVEAPSGLAKLLNQHNPTTVLIDNESQRASAEAYVKHELETHRDGDVKIEIATDPTIRTGQQVNGRTAFRYLYSEPVSTIKGD